MANFNEKIYFYNIKKLRLAKSVFGLKAYLKELFKESIVDKKTVLDIGAGAGTYSCYMAMNGAKEVISLEPEIAGSENNYIIKFEELKNNLKLNNVFLMPLTFQSFDNKEKKFDVILLHHSINHLNEEACIDLKKSDRAKEIYKEIFKKLHFVSTNQAQIIIADCSNYNIFNLLKIKNPFAPTIEWHKHQSPEEWIKILREVGFKKFKVKWILLNQLGRVGNFFLGNKICSFFINSHFIIYANK
jgi:SAM-dependent methyltransferase